MGEGWSVRWTDAKHRLAKADGQDSLGIDRSSVPAGQEVGISDQARCRASKPFAEWHPTGGKRLGRLEQENARLKAQVAAHDMGIEVMALRVSGCSGVFADGLPSTPSRPTGCAQKTGDGKVVSSTAEDARLPWDRDAAAHAMVDRPFCDVPVPMDRPRRTAPGLIWINRASGW